MLGKLWDQLSYIFTSLSKYHGRQAVVTGSCSVFMEYLEEVTGITLSMSPLQVSLRES